MSEDALKLAQQIAHEVWEKYDDTYGYRIEKQERNAAQPLTDPDAIWFFWNQFDNRNHLEFIARLMTTPRTPGLKELKDFCLAEYNREADIERRMGLDF